MQKERRKLEITLPSDVDAETLEAVINGIGVKLVITSENHLTNQPIEIVTNDATIESEPHFDFVYQGTATNEFTKTRPTKKNTKHFPTIETYQIQRGDLIVTIPEEYWPTGLKTSTHQLLDAVMVKLAATGAATPDVLIPHKEYMSMRNLTAWPSAQRRAQADITMLIHTSITRKSSSKKPGQSFKVLNFFEKGEVTKKGDIKVTFTPTFFNMITDPNTFHVMPYPKLLFRLNNKKNPNSYYLLRKIAELKNLNIGKSNEDIISVRVLLENAPFLPKEEDMPKNPSTKGPKTEKRKGADRHLSRRIIDVFGRDMDALQEELVWGLCHKNGILLTEEEYRNLDYKLFKTLMVKVEWKNYPPRVLTKAPKKAKK